MSAGIRPAKGPSQALAIGAAACITVGVLLGLALRERARQHEWSPAQRVAYCRVGKNRDMEVMFVAIDSRLPERDGQEVELTVPQGWSKCGDLK